MKMANDKILLMHLAYYIVLLTIVSSTPVPITPTMTPTGEECSTVSKQGYPLNSPKCQVKEEMFEFRLEGCEPVRRCLSMCSGLCGTHNDVMSEPPYKSLHCPRCIPNKNYNEREFKLHFKCDGKFKEPITLTHRKIQKCRCSNAA